MGVAVDDSRQDQPAAAVDRIVSIQAVTDIDDPVAVQDDICLEHLAGRGIEHRPGGQQGARHELTPTAPAVCIAVSTSSSTTTAPSLNNG